MSDEISAKTLAREVLDMLPNAATWDEVMYALRVRQAIELGLADAVVGRSIPHAEVRTRVRDLLCGA